MATADLIPTECIEQAILVIRKQKVLLDRDLAELYGVPTKRLNEQVRRNIRRFPEDFMFQLTVEEALASRSQIATLKRGQNIKYLPYAFTEQGVAMLSSVLNSDRAIDVNVAIMRTFVLLFLSLLWPCAHLVERNSFRSSVVRNSFRTVVVGTAWTGINSGLRRNGMNSVLRWVAGTACVVRLRKLLATHKDLARKLKVLERKYDSQFGVVDSQFRDVFEAIRQLMTPPSEPEKKRRIGFARD